MAKQTAGPADVELGARIRLRRLARRMSQAELGKAVGKSQQQIRKYENGEALFSVSFVVSVANALGLTLQILTDRLDANTLAHFGFAETEQGTYADHPPLDDDTTRRLNEAFRLIRDSKARESLAYAAERFLVAERLEAVERSGIDKK